MQTQEILFQIKDKIFPSAFKNLEKWLKNEEYKEFWPEILKLIKEKNYKELNDAFYTIIPFGTGGRRGKIGVGTNRINNRTIAESAQGLASYLLKAFKKIKRKSIVIAFDSRRNSKEFAKICAEVFCGNNFKTYLFSNLRSTPELSFAVRYLKAQAGVVISASHNPPSDNGFKVYWEDGGQIIPPYDKKVIEEVNRVKTIKRLNLATARKKRILIKIGEQIDKAYIEAITSVSLGIKPSAKIVFSPLCGTGFTSVLPALKKCKILVYPLRSQIKPDGEFKNVYNHIPNPEFPKTQDKAIDYAKKIKADLVVTSDPDADRLGAAFPDKNGNWQCLTGNQIGILLLNFLLEQRKFQKKLSPSNLVVKTFVTTDLISQIARKYNVRVIENLLVGFKYIADVIKKQKNPSNFIFGGEESHGFLFSEVCRDKDAAQAALIFSELASYLKNQRKILDQYLEEIYQKFGYFKENLYNMVLEGAEGKERIKKIMTVMRKNPLKELNERKVLKMIDWQEGKIIDVQTGKEIERLKLDFYGEMITLILSDDNFWKITLRPSGTEPKAKFYISGKGDFKDRKKVDDEVEKITKFIKKLTEMIK